MPWLADTSAWARRHIPEVGEQLKELLNDDELFVLSPAVLLELLRGPQGDAVREERRSLTDSMETVVPDATTWSIAADMMEGLALHGPEAHRFISVTDFVTAALAHQHGMGVVHVDGDYELIAEHSGRGFEHRRIALVARDSEHPVAGAQRELKRELSQLLHQMPVEDAEALLDRFVEEARKAVAAG